MTTFSAKLSRAVATGDATAVRAALDRLPPGAINAQRRRDGATALLIALQRRTPHVDVVRALLEHGADPDGCSAKGRRPLHCISTPSHSELARTLLEHGANPALDSTLDFVAAHCDRSVLELACQGLTRTGPQRTCRRGLPQEPAASASQVLDCALVAASGQGRLENVRCLLAFGASPSARTRCARRFSAVAAAARANRIDCLGTLIAAGADINQIADRATPLGWAASEGHIRCLDRLLAAGARVNGQPRSRNTPLHYAASHGHEECVLRLLAAGANPRIGDRTGRQALHYAAWNGHASIVSHLLASGAPAHLGDVDGSTPLHLAVAHDHAECARLLLDAGAVPNTPNARGSTPILAGARDLSHDLLRLLLGHGADIHHRNGRGADAVIAFAAHGRDDALATLQAHGADMGSRDFAGSTALHALAKTRPNTPAEASQDRTRRTRRCAEILLAGGAHLNAPDVEGNTPLHAAVSCFHEDLVEALLDQPALDINRPNREGRTALHILAGHIWLERDSKPRGPGLLQRMIGAGADPCLTTPTGLTPVDDALLNGNHRTAEHLSALARARSLGTSPEATTNPETSGPSL